VDKNNARGGETVKVKVLKRYSDKNLRELREEGETYEYESEERVEELVKGGYVEIAKSEEPKKPKDK